MKIILKTSISGPAGTFPFNSVVDLPDPEAAAMIAAGTAVAWAGTVSPLVLASSAVPVSLTGSTAETALATISLPAGSMGPNGILRVTTLWSFTSSANGKTMRVRLGGIAGPAFMAVALTTNTSLRYQTQIANRNSLTSQIGAGSASGGGGWGGNSGALQTGAIDTSVAQDLVLTGALALGTETITLEYFLIEIVPG